MPAAHALPEPPEPPHTPRRRASSALLSAGHQWQGNGFLLPCPPARQLKQKTAPGRSLLAYPRVSAERAHHAGGAVSGGEAARALRVVF